jgi:hypothetical protein
MLHSPAAGVSIEDTAGHKHPRGKVHAEAPHDWRAERSPVEKPLMLSSV